MNACKKYIPSFGPDPVRLTPDRSMFPAEPPLEIEAIGQNSIRIRIGSVSRVVDGVTLSNAVNECIGNFRAARR